MQSGIAFFAPKCQFCLVKFYEMERFLCQFNAFLEDRETLADGRVSFAHVCRDIGVDGPAFDAWLRDNFGLGGAEIMDRFRNDIWG